MLFGVVLCSMPNNAMIRGLEAPQLVVMDLLGVFMENNDSVKAAIAAAFQAHGVRIDEDLATSSLGFPNTQGIESVLRWLHPLEQPHKETVRSIHALAVKELTRMMTYAGSIEPSAGVVRLCEQWHKCGVAVAAVSTLQSDTVKAMLRRFGWDEHPPFHALVLAEEINMDNFHADVIKECMRRLGVAEVSAVAKVSTRARGLVNAKKLGCGWKVLLDAGSLTTDQIAALGPDIIVNHVTDLAFVWKFPARPDTALEDEISKMLQHN